MAYPIEVQRKMRDNEWFCVFRPDDNLNINCETVANAEEVYDNGFAIEIRIRFNPSSKGKWFSFPEGIERKDVFDYFENIPNSEKYKLIYAPQKKDVDNAEEA